jgi:hypothetical protein
MIPRLLFVSLLIVTIQPAVSAEGEWELLAGRGGFAAGSVTLVEDSVEGAVSVTVTGTADLDAGTVWLIKKAQLYLGVEPVPTARSGNPRMGRFPFKKAHGTPVTDSTFVLEGECPLLIGEEPDRNFAVHADLVLVDIDSGVALREAIGAWAWQAGAYSFDGPAAGWWSIYRLGCLEAK